ncbi:MAG: apolipoprotein N-acyltransferase [Candidatus Pelagibacter sp.]
MVTSLSLPPYNYFIINFFTFSLFFLFLIKKMNQHSNKKTFFFYGWLFGFGYFFTNLYWISISLSFDQNFKFLIPLTVILIPSFLAIFYGLVSYFLIFFKRKKIINNFLIFSLVFGILEFIRGTILTGFPWNLIAYSFSKQVEFLSIISVIGTYGFNLVCISLFTSPVFLIMRDSKKDILVSIFSLFIVIIFYLNGILYSEKFNSANKKIYDYKIRVISSKISLDRFYLDIRPETVIEELIELSNPILSEKIIFVWPEGIIPGISQEKLVQYKWLFNEKFSQNHFLIVGTNTQITKNKSKIYFNSLSVYNNELEIIDSYNKIKLVPFGEFLPFEKILKKIGLRSITNNYQSYTNGEKRNIIEVGNKEHFIKILPLICYEMIYSGKLFDNPKFDLIINISEDGWFGKSIGPRQHFAHSILRAIESGKYVLRSANNGVAAIINPLGVIEQNINFGASGYIDFKESKKIQPTIFSKFGNKIFGLLILLYIFLIFSFNRMYNE